MLFKFVLPEETLTGWKKLGALLGDQQNTLFSIKTQAITQVNYTCIQNF